VKRIARIVSLNGSMADPLTSHRAAWAWIRARQLETQKVFHKVLLGDAPSILEVTDIIYYWGMEWSGALNLFGGATKKNGDRLRKILDHRDQGLKQWCLDMPMPDVGALASNRQTFEEGWEEQKPGRHWHALSKACEDVEPLHQKHGRNPRTVIGDSHAMSLWTLGSYVSRNDHKTLHGVLDDRQLAYNPIRATDVIGREVWLYFGNIDIRHHLTRQDQPTVAASLLVRDYARVARELLEHRGAKTVTLVEALPIPLDTRRIPKSGFYKGTPFYGTWQQREAVRSAFNVALHDEARKISNCKVFKWPAWMVDESGALIDEHMEKPGSVHLALKTTLRLIDEELI